MKRTHKKQIGWKIATAICIILFVTSLSFNGYMVIRYNRMLSELGQDASITYLISKLSHLSNVNDETQESIINLIRVMGSNDNLILEMIRELELKLENSPTNNTILL